MDIVALLPVLDAVYDLQKCTNANCPDKSVEDLTSKIKAQTRLFQTANTTAKQKAIAKKMKALTDEADKSAAMKTYKECQYKHCKAHMMLMVRGSLRMIENLEAKDRSGKFTAAMKKIKPLLQKILTAKNPNLAAFTKGMKATQTALAKATPSYLLSSRAARR